MSTGTHWTPDRRAALRARDDAKNLGRLTYALGYVAAALLLGVMFAATFAGCVSVSAEVSEAAEKHLGHVRALNRLTVPAAGLSQEDTAMVAKLKAAVEETAARLRDLARPK